MNLAEVLASGTRSNGPLVAKEFSVEAIARKIVDVYETVVRRRTDP